jgi:putative tryptophan/tyrosine transport system substrate-binding protein
MVGKRKFSVLVLSLFMGVFTLVGCNTTDSNQNSNKESSKKIGITQIVEHPALDAARNGFIDALKENGFEQGKNIEIDFQNAQGDMATTQTIAQKFVSDKVDMIFAISTPSAQSAYNATKEIPIVITAVTDPVEAGIANSFDNSGTNITGTSDNVPIKSQFELLKNIVPSAKKVGILYSTSESNSQIQINAAKEISSDFEIEIITQGITNVNEVPEALNSIIDDIDVLYVPTDNLVVSALPIITNKCYEKGIAIIGAEKGQVEAGVLATAGIDYYKLGKQSGLNAVEILNGKKPTEIPITELKETAISINKDAANKLKITISDNIKAKAEIITGGVN